SLVAHPLFCELVSAQALVLERKISAETAIAFKRTSLADLDRLAGLLVLAVPELADKDPARLASRCTLLAGALWAQTRATESLPAELAAAHEDFAAAVCDTFEALVVGTISR